MGKQNVLFIGDVPLRVYRWDHNIDVRDGRYLHDLKLYFRQEDIPKAVEALRAQVAPRKRLHMYVAIKETNPAILNRPARFYLVAHNLDDNNENCIPNGIREAHCILPALRSFDPSLEYDVITGLNYDDMEWINK